MTQCEPSDRGGGAGAQRADAYTPGAGDEKGPEAARRILDDLVALREQATLYLAARRDQIRLGARNALIGAVLGLMAVLIAAAILMSAAALLVAGIALGLAEALGGRLWLGALLTGTAVIGLTALAGYLTVRRMLQASRRNTLDRYAELHQRQQKSVRAGTAQAAAGARGT